MLSLRRRTLKSLEKREEREKKVDKTQKREKKITVPFLFLKFPGDPYDSPVNRLSKCNKYTD